MRGTAAAEFPVQAADELRKGEREMKKRFADTANTISNDGFRRLLAAAGRMTVLSMTALTLMGTPVLVHAQEADPGEVQETEYQDDAMDAVQDDSPDYYQEDEAVDSVPDDTPYEAPVTYPSFGVGNVYYPGGTISNDSNQDITVCFEGYDNVSAYTVNLAAYGGSHTVQSRYGNAIATKDCWICRSVSGTNYVFSANDPDIPAQPQPQAPKKEEKKEEKKQAYQHTCNMEWVTVKEPTMKSDGLMRYQCKDCGKVEMQVPISAATTYITGLYSAIDKAPLNGTVVYDAQDYYTISKYVLQKMAQRNDVTVAIRFNYKNTPYVVVFPAKTDYTQLLAGKSQFYGFLGLNGYNGIAVAKQ